MSKYIEVELDVYSDSKGNVYYDRRLNMKSCEHEGCCQMTIKTADMNNEKNIPVCSLGCFKKLCSGGKRKNINKN
jgi:hypothetical protein